MPSNSRPPTGTSRRSALLPGLPASVALPVTRRLRRLPPTSRPPGDERVRRRPVSVLAACVAGLTLAPGLALADNEVEVDGWISSSYEIRDRIGPEADVLVELETDRVYDVEAVIELRGRAFRQRAEFRDTFVDWKPSKRLRLQLGFNRKRLGLEYEQGRRKRLTAPRSFIYREMEEMGIVGRQLNFRVVGKPKDGLITDLSLGTDGSRNANLLVRVADERGSVSYGTWGLVERHRVDKGFIFVWAQALSAWHISPTNRAVVELIAGIDPFETDLARQLGDGDRVFFAGPKVEVARKLFASETFAIEPFVQSSFVFHDASALDHNTLQVLFGVNTHFRGLLFAIHVEYLGTTNRTPPHDRITRWPNAFSEVRFHF